MPTTALARHRFDPANELDETATAMLAVANNPHLKVLRDQLGITRAEAFNAGLLPDPQLAWSQDFVTGGSGGPDATSPFGLGVAYDFGALLTHSTRVAAAHWQEKQADLDLLWAEWQTVAKSRILFTRVLETRQQVARLKAETRVLAPLARRIRHALSNGGLSTDLAMTGLSAVTNAEQQLATAQGTLVQAQQALRTLLDLRASAPLHLAGPSRVIAPDAAQVRDALAALPQRRPDLLALQAGYQSQNAKLRQAILQQFPALNIGFNRARDNAGVYTSGFAISLTLPLFNRNRGAIAIARATRRQLRGAYAARLLQTRNNVQRLLAQLRFEQTELPRATTHARHLDGVERRGRAAFTAHDLDLSTYLALRSAALDADLQLIHLRQTRAATGIALQTLLGGHWSASAMARMRADDTLASTQ
ncbi:MAG TPA: TolC family protein [Nevskiaceae bacterium]|nr:TolC family protein [Nevskiaceae bacterium]